MTLCVLYSVLETENSMRCLTVLFVCVRVCFANVLDYRASVQHSNGVAFDTDIHIHHVSKRNVALKRIIVGSIHWLIQNFVTINVCIKRNTVD